MAPVRPEYLSNPVLRDIDELKRQVGQLSQRSNAVLVRSSLRVADSLSHDATVRMRYGMLPDQRYGQALYDSSGNELVRLGELPDGRVGQTVYDTDGNELLRLGEQADGTTALAVFDGDGDEQSRLDADGVSVVRSGVRTNVADYVFGQQFGFVPTQESTSSEFPTDLTTDGPSVTVDVGASGRVWLMAGALISPNSAFLETGLVYYTASGANTISETLIASFGGTDLPTGTPAGGRLLDGLNVGATTFKLRYAVFNSNPVLFDQRWIMAHPL